MWRRASLEQKNMPQPLAPPYPLRASAPSFLSELRTPAAPTREETYSYDDVTEAATFDTVEASLKASVPAAYQKALAEGKAARKSQDAQILKDPTKAETIRNVRKVRGASFLL